MPANIAILIDAENVDPSFANQVFSYARSLGEVTVREIYGAGIALNEWADPILENTIHTNFTLRPNRFKNSSDIALTIGAMELLSASRAAESRKIDAVIIASSDSDFSPLAFHLRAAGIDVIGMGEPGRINPMWPKACTEFVALTPGQPLTRQNRSSQPEAVSGAASPSNDTALPEKPPVIADAEPSPAPKEEKQPRAAAKPQKAEKAAAIAKSHSGRLEIIRSFIMDQLAAHGGKVKSGELFKLLSVLPDYKFDQQRSRRKPLDYLEKQYSEWFVLEPGEKGSYWISLRQVGAQASPVSDEQETEPSAENAADESALPDDPRVALIDAGIPVQYADRVAAILSESKTLFAAYNGLTKAYGRKQGKEFYRLIKEHFASEPSDNSSGESAENAVPVQAEMPELAAEEEKAEAPTEEAQWPEETPEQNGEAAEQPLEAPTDPLGSFLAEKGLPAETADQIAAIVASTPNLRVAYNGLRKAFGANQGREYLSLVKAFKNQE